jgi:hypothetical protein
MIFLFMNTKLTPFKREIEFKMQAPVFITQHKQSGLFKLFWKVDHFVNNDSN